jgi:hypothetical protein
VSHSWACRNAALNAILTDSGMSAMSFNVWPSQTIRLAGLGSASAIIPILEYLGRL